MGIRDIGNKEASNVAKQTSNRSPTVVTTGKLDFAVR
jgi:hypothetical protein